MPKPKPIGIALIFREIKKQHQQQQQPKISNRKRVQQNIAFVRVSYLN